MTVETILKTGGAVSYLWNRCQWKSLFESTYDQCIFKHPFICKTYS